jgi:hypothetical protein
MQILIMQYSTASCHFIPLLDPNILPGTLFPNTLNLCNNVRDQVSHSYERTGKIVVCPPVLSSIPDRVPEMDENWTFGVYSSLHALGGAQDGFILDSTFLNQNL